MWVGPLADLNGYRIELESSSKDAEETEYTPQDK